MIIKTTHVSSPDPETFLERLSQSVRSFQEEGLKVEIQYHPISANGSRFTIFYDALVHGRKEENNG